MYKNIKIISFILSTLIINNNLQAANIEDMDLQKDIEMFSKPKTNLLNDKLDKTKMKKNSNKPSPIVSMNYKEGEVLEIQVEYAKPTKVVFPGYIERLEYLEGVGGLTIERKSFNNGDDSLLMTREQNINKDTVVYVTVLGKRITLIVKYAEIDYGNSLVKVLIPVENDGTESSNQMNITPPKVYKKIKSKDLTRETNIKSVGMLVHMLKGDAAEYYSSIDLNRKLQTSESGSFFNFLNKKDEETSKIIFKSLFENNPYFIESFEKRFVKPVELYEDNYIVVKSDINKEKMDIYGLKMQMCNYSKEESMTINVDDIKTIIGKNILSVKHPMEKIQPMHCDDVYVVFYKMNKDKI